MTGPSAQTNPKPPSAWRERRDFWFSSEARRLQFFTAAAVLIMALLGAQHFRLEKDLAGAQLRVENGAEIAYVAPVPAMRIASLGNQGAMADLLFLRAAHYFVAHLITDSRLPWLDLYLETLWGLDAHLRQTYRWGCQVIKFGQRIDDDVARRANHMARLGLEYYPDEAWLYHEIAFNLRYSIEGKTPEETKALRDLALKYLDVAYSFPGFVFDPSYLVGQDSRAGRSDDSVQAALATYAQATEVQRQTLRQMLLDRNKNSLAKQLAWFDFSAQTNWPWAQPTLAILLGPKPQLAPPLQVAHPENWPNYPQANAAKLKDLGVPALEAPDGDGWLPDELAGKELWLAEKNPATYLPADASPAH